MQFISVVEFIGTVAFAISGALIAIEKGLDYYGIAFFAIITATGGGIIRDMMSSGGLPAALANPVYVIVSLVSAAIVILFYQKIKEYHNVLQFFDAIGLSAFTAIGAEVAIKYGMDVPFAIVTLAVLTGTGGGALRDVFAKEIPFVFRKEIYAVASIIGAMSFLLTYHFMSKFFALYVCFAVTLVIRLVCMGFELHLPTVTRVHAQPIGKKEKEERGMRLLWDLFATFFKLGLFTIGGGMAMLPLIRDLAVDKKGWLTDDEVVDCFAVCQALPGVIAINTATYIGKKEAGLKGAICTSVGVILPSFFIIIAVILFLGAINENAYINGAFEGIKAASAGLILFAAYKMGKQVMRGKLAWFIGIISFLIIVVLGITALWAIVFGGVGGFIAHLVEKNRAKKNDTNEKEKKGGEEA